MKYVIIVFLIIQYLNLFAQDSLTFVFQRNIQSSHISQIDLDDQSNFLVLNESHFLKISPQLDTLYSFFHLQQNETAISFQSHSLQSFLFSKEAQKILVLNRFLTKHSDITIPEELFTFMELACITNDQYLWIVDMENLSLKKYNYHTKNLIFETPLISIINEDFTPLQLSFYNNLLFLHYNQGIFVFDIFGNFKYNLPVQVSSFSFYLDNILFINTHQITSYHLFKHIENNYSIPFSLDFKHILYNGKFFFLFNNTKMFVYKKRSQ